MLIDETCRAQSHARVCSENIAATAKLSRPVRRLAGAQACEDLPCPESAQNSTYG